ncbi:hypothetical protein RO21_09665 [[Actinobacillus] muris]|uniref:Cytochrome-c oxidase n=1 Tax=Muribacter muris TaxID=67855 RepID=A0A0J5P559_9PAST|nr:hypothetical protein [Muribacter muris]KMK50840.1 hypothetical protein RO21_09665 [[Actinobacillus] muris] [Muribacter muris]
MKLNAYFTFLCASFTALSALAFADNSQQVRSIDIYITPYYSAHGGKVEHVAVHPELDPLLKSNSVASLKKAIAQVEKEPQLITPMVMFTLAARSYDLGLRDDAVFWFYAGRYRLITAMDVLDLPKSSLAEYSSFATLVGKFILPYAFCDHAKNSKIKRKALQWVKDHPYQALFLAQLPSKQPDRKKALAQSEKALDKNFQESENYLKDPKKKADFLAKRKAENTDARFCWK